MFEQCSNFTISGGVFTIQKEPGLIHPARSCIEGPLESRSTPNFQSIRLGDLNLLAEIGKDDIVEYRDIRRRRTGVLVRRQRVVVGTRRIYQARVFGLVSLQEVREFNSRSPLASTYVEYGIKRDLYAAFKYWESETGTWLLSPGAPNYTSWIRVSTGRLCIDVGTSFSAIKHLDVKSLVRNPVSRATSIGYCEGDLELILISRLELDDIHVLVSSRASYETTEVSFRVGCVALGEIWPASDVKEVARFPADTLTVPPMLTPREIVSQPWWYWKNGLRTPRDTKDVMASGWTRVTLQPNMQQAHHLTTRVKIDVSRRREMQKYWLSQANSLAPEGGSKISTIDKYYIPSGVKFRISIWYPHDNFTLRGTFMADVPKRDIYLFLFQPRVECLDGYPVIRIPPASEAFYWSIDPRGATKLTSEMAEEIGVPYVFFETWVTGVSWTRRDYEILAEFHGAKGFNPLSRDVASNLGYPLIKGNTTTHTSLSEINSNEVESTKEALKTYPKQAVGGATSRCEQCGGRQPAVQNMMLPDLEMSPIHRHRKYRNVFVRADTG
ncbi:hypothetical protein DFH09DRAFT_1304320 [Mycena vulgaris]|nr:hypothetical protein DFH09DRAFT_1304320 [Mycena vulgaris]